MITHNVVSPLPNVITPPVVPTAEAQKPGKAVIRDIL
jgi:hypothetical protein